MMMTLRIALFGIVIATYVAFTIAACDRRAEAADAQSLTVGDALSLLQALRNLDGHAVPTKQNGAETVVIVPWEFGSGTLRAKIATDIWVLSQVERAVDDARRAIVAEILAKMPADKDGNRPVSIPPGTSEFADFQRQLEAATRAPAALSTPLARIKVGELKLDRNEIPVTALAAMAPILDDDGR